MPVVIVRYTYVAIPLASTGRLSRASRTTVAGRERTALVVRHTSAAPLSSVAVYSGDEKEIDMSVEGRIIVSVNSLPCKENPII